MKLIKLNTDHYIIIDDSEIKEGDWYIDDTKSIRQSITSDQSYWSKRKEYKKITHSTQPESLGMGWMQSVLPLLLSEVKELIGEVDVEKKASEYAINDFDDYAFCGYISGYNQALEDNKEKKWTDEDVIRIVEKSRETGLTAEYLMMTFQLKTEWEVEIVDGKLKLK